MNRSPWRCRDTFFVGTLLVGVLFAVVGHWLVGGVCILWAWSKMHAIYYD